MGQNNQLPYAFHLRVSYDWLPDCMALAYHAFRYCADKRRFSMRKVHFSIFDFGHANVRGLCGPPPSPDRTQVVVVLRPHSSCKH